MREWDDLPKLGDMGAFHGWGLGTVPRASIRRQRATRRALALVVESTRDVVKLPAEPRGRLSARRHRRLHT
jgi:hypothetical protein